MNRDQNTGNESDKHISMELSAESVRVTNLSLEGGRLIMTIEADLANSQLRAPSIPAGDALKSALLAAAIGTGSGTPPAPAAKAPAAPANPSGAATMPSLGAPLSDDALLGGKPGGSEALAPAPAPVPAAKTPPIISVPPMAPPSPTLQPPAPGHPIPHSSLAPPQLGPSTRVGDAAPVPAAPPRPAKPMEPPAPRPEPKITETWDPSELGVVPSLLPRAVPAPATPGEIKMDDFPAMAPPPPAKKPSAPAASHGTGVISLGDPTDSVDWGALAPAGKNAAALPPLQMENWDTSGLSLAGSDAADEPLAMSEESSAIGGERHGEPQPAISFGMDQPVVAKPKPAAGPSSPAPAFSFGFADGPAPVAPAAPKPSIGPAAPGAPLSFEFEAPKEPTPRKLTPGGAAPISLGDDSPGMEIGALGGPSISLGGDDDGPGIGLGSPGSPSISLGDESPTLDLAPLGGPSISLGGDESPTLDLNPSAGPAIGFGGDESPTLDLASPGGAIGLGGMPTIGFDSPAAPPPRPGGVAAISLGPDPDQAPGLGLGAPGKNPNIGFETPPGLSLESAPPPPVKPQPAPFAPQPAPAPLSMEPPTPGPGFQSGPKQPLPAPEPATLPNIPPPAKEEEPPARQNDAPAAPKSSVKSEAGGTTVLIRYTCPKCKTQGMQAVDKVGTVVNCSNCGKAMRLVMRK